jgi:hypothetical protein
MLYQVHLTMSGTVKVLFFVGKKKLIEKMNTLISTSDYIILRLICLMYWSFLKVLIPSETCHVENIKSMNFILVQTQNPRIYESTNLYFLTKPRKLLLTKKSTITVPLITVIWVFYDRGFNQSKAVIIFKPGIILHAQWTAVTNWIHNIHIKVLFHRYDS